MCVKRPEYAEALVEIVSLAAFCLVLKMTTPWMGALSLKWQDPSRGDEGHCNYDQVSEAHEPRPFQRTWIK